MIWSYWQSLRCARYEPAAGVGRRQFLGRAVGVILYCDHSGALPFMIAGLASAFPSRWSFLWQRNLPGQRSGAVISSKCRSRYFESIRCLLIWSCSAPSGSRPISCANAACVVCDPGRCRAGRSAGRRDQSSRGGWSRADARRKQFIASGRRLSWRKSPSREMRGERATNPARVTRQFSSAGADLA